MSAGNDAHSDVSLQSTSQNTGNGIVAQSSSEVLESAASSSDTATSATSTKAAPADEISSAVNVDRHEIAETMSGQIGAPDDSPRPEEGKGQSLRDLGDGKPIPFLGELPLKLQSMGDRPSPAGSVDGDSSPKAEIGPGKLPYRKVTLLEMQLKNGSMPKTEKSKPEDDEHEKYRARGGPNERYVCYHDELGSGAYKTVYKGMDVEEAREIAWCEMKVQRLSVAEKKRLNDEVKLLQKVRHKNVVAFFCHWTVAKPRSNDGQEQRVFITELMTSGTLKHFLRNTGCPKPRVLQNWCKQILLGLKYMHDKGIIHRDLKCDNIFIEGTTGEVKIGDLGLAMMVLKDVTMKCSVIGTPEFMAPEMYSEEYSYPIDVWAFGMCVLEMITLEYPYSECGNPIQIYRKALRGIKPAAFSNITGRNAKVRRDFILQCICLNPDERATVTALLQHDFFKPIKDDSAQRVNKAMTTIDVSKVSEEGVAEMVLRKTATQESAGKVADKTRIKFTMDVYHEHVHEVVENMMAEGLIALPDKPAIENTLKVAVASAKADTERIRALEAQNTAESDVNVSKRPAPPPIEGLKDQHGKWRHSEVEDEILMRDDQGVQEEEDLASTVAPPYEAIASEKGGPQSETATRDNATSVHAVSGNADIQEAEPMPSTASDVAKAATEVASTGDNVASDVPELMQPTHSVSTSEAEGVLELDAQQSPSVLTPAVVPHSEAPSTPTQSKSTGELPNDDEDNNCKSTTSIGTPQMPPTTNESEVSETSSPSSDHMEDKMSAKSTSTTDLFAKNEGETRQDLASSESSKSTTSDAIEPPEGSRSTSASATDEVHEILPPRERLPTALTNLSKVPLSLLEETLLKLMKDGKFADVAAFCVDLAQKQEAIANSDLLPEGGIQSDSTEMQTSMPNVDTTPNSDKQNSNSGTDLDSQPLQSSVNGVVACEDLSPTAQNGVHTDASSVSIGSCNESQVSGSDPARTSNTWDVQQPAQSILTQSLASRDTQSSASSGPGMASPTGPLMTSKQPSPKRGSFSSGSTGNSAPKLNGARPIDELFQQLKDDPLGIRTSSVSGNRSRNGTLEKKAKDLFTGRAS